ncbi:uncharacterized protein LOC129599549 [Paramacrobiotus metropolitanus]|uniref:uncharacterized protein LOC129597895 n=2 Tax=Paramacrobiotus metropolitanus TaxID=2943436 RepID=UPI00244595D9|nr:uncharacterized protein LOC129597895 [Paramacrobiotus metropolitanus]XP_055353806.1 uncharacterized protein LOC129599549 [Paramacrobiotus metropolitanus]
MAAMRSVDSVSGDNSDLLAALSSSPSLSTIPASLQPVRALTITGTKKRKVTADSYKPKTDAVSLARRGFTQGQVAFQYEGGPVIKFGGEKFIAVYLMNNRLRYIIGEFDKNQEGQWVPSLASKHVELDAKQFAKLMGLQLCGQLERLINYDEGSTPITAMHDLGGGYFFNWGWLDEVPIANIRVYLEANSLKEPGTKVVIGSPSEKRLAMNEKNWTAFCELLDNGTILKHTYEVLKGRSGYPTMQVCQADYQDIFEKLPWPMMERFCKRLTQECKLCHLMEDTFADPLQPGAHDGHTACRYSDRIQLTDRMRSYVCKDVEKTLLGLFLKQLPYRYADEAAHSHHNAERNLLEAYHFKPDEFLVMHGDRLCAEMLQRFKEQFKLN